MEKVNSESKQKRSHQSIGWAFALFVITVLAVVIFKFPLEKISVANTPTARYASDTALEKQIDTRGAAYRLAITYPDGTRKNFSLDDIGIDVDIAATITAIRDIQTTIPFYERLAWWKTLQVPLVLKIDHAALSNFISEHVTIVEQPAQNAAIKVVGGTATISSGSPGNGYILPNVSNTILTAVRNLESEPLRLEPGSLQPKISTQNLDKPRQQVDKLLNQTVSFTVAGKKITATKNDIGTWLDIEPDVRARNLKVSINGGKVFDYISKITKPYASSYRSQIIMSLPDGSTATLVPGPTGLESDKKDAITSGLASTLAAANGIEVNLNLQYSNLRIPTYSYDKWLAVDLSTKRMYAYEKTNLSRTFLVSAGAPATPTTPGFHKIYSKVRRQDMRGPNADGTSYFQANVEWVNYFHSGEAIHGNYWRPLSYFGNVNSSHGCVGIVNSDAQWIYNWAPVGTPVIVYN